MIRTVFSVAALTAGLGAMPLLAADLEPIIGPAALASYLAEDDSAPVVLDIRGDAYANGHIEGAVSAPYGLFRGPADNPGQLLPVDQLEATYESLGLDPARPVVIVVQGASDTDFGAAARVYWTLKSSGFEDLSILNGGAQAWANAGLPLDDTPVTPEPTALDITWNNAWTAETPFINEVVAGERDAHLLDARPEAFFEGKQSHGAAARPGTLPGAENYAYTGFFIEGATAISPVTDVDRLTAVLGIDTGETVVSFCNTGHWAATNWFALSELAGYDDVKLYPGSMVEYAATDGEMANVPGLFDNLLQQFKRN